MNRGKPIISFNNRIFLSVLLVFILFAGSFIIYQYQREKHYRVENFNTQLQGINNRIYTLLPTVPTEKEMAFYIEKYLIDYPGIHITIIKKGEGIIFDSFAPESPTADVDYWELDEIKQALEIGSGYQIRLKVNTKTRYFFSAALYPNFIIRSAVPYDGILKSALKTDTRYITFSLLITISLLVLFYSYTNKLGHSIRKLRGFAQRAENNENIQWETEVPYAAGELGEVTQHIINVYKSLHAANEALIIEREKLFAHLQTSREGLGIFSAKGTEILVNRLFIRFCNQIADVNLQVSEDVFQITEFQPVIDFIRNAHKDGEDSNLRRYSLPVNKNGKNFIVETIIFEDMSFELSINDITKEEEKSQLKKQITQNIAHELKTPVSSIQGYLETLLYHQNIPEEKKVNFLTRCYAQSQRLSKLLQDLAVLTRIEESFDMLDKQKININELVKDILEEIDLDLKKKNIRVYTDLKDSINIDGNYSLIYSIFRNLLDNSIAHAGEDIDITINCFKESNELYYFSYHDTGVGIPTEHLNRLFERFYRVDKGRTRKLGGTGLGLAIVKNSVLIHKGNILVKNDANKGVEFVFTLPKLEDKKI